MSARRQRMQCLFPVLATLCFVAVLLPGAAAASTTPASGTAANFNTFYAFKHYPDIYLPTAAGIVQGGDGRIYGVGQTGGPCSGGVYSIGLADTSETVVHSFLCNAQNQTEVSSGAGYGPGKAGVVDGGDGWYYGTTTASYDAAQAGQVYRVKPNGQFQILHAWWYADEGGHVEPSGRLLLASDGYLYGVTSTGGYCRGPNHPNGGPCTGSGCAPDANATGSVYRIKVTDDPNDPNAFHADFKTVYAFCHTALDDIGQSPVAGLVQGADGALYGTTRLGGGDYSAQGTVFKLTVDSNGDGSVQTLHSFSGGSADGYDAEAALLPTDGGTAFYGTTAFGNYNNNGEVFKITSGGDYSVVHNFGNDWGKVLYSSVTYGPGQFLYGVTWSGGAYNEGTIYALDPESGTVNFLYSFDGGDHGGGPYSPLLTASDGNFYGTTEDWGPYSGCGSCGTLFKASFVAVRVRTPADGATYDQNSTHKADYSCYGSGDAKIDSCVGDVPVGDPIDTSTLGKHSFTVTGTDVNGTKASRTVDYTVVAPTDGDPPTSHATSPPLTNQTSFKVDYTAFDPSPSAGLDRVELWAKGPGDTGYSLVATDFTPGAGGSFDYNATQGDGNYSFYTRALDKAGHYEDAPSSADTTTKVDTAPPTITITTPQDGGTYSQDEVVKADYGCADEAGGSGLADPPDGCNGDVANGSPVDTSTTGQHSFTVTAKDQAGNKVTKTVHYTVVPPNHPPTITITTPKDGATYAQNDVVKADYSCDDPDIPDGDQVDCQGDVANGAPVDTSTTGQHSFTVTAKDQAGNKVTKTVHYTVVDNTPPTITITTPKDGATYTQNSVVKADYSCQDEPGGSGLADPPDGCNGDVPNGSQIDTSTLGTHSFTVTAKDKAGNPATKTVHYTVVDATPPTITITTPKDGATYTQNSVVKADYFCQDEPGGSGLADPPDGCKGDVPNGSAIDTSTLGTHSFTVTAKDKAGNPASQTVHYTVVDATPPTITITTPKDGATYYQYTSLKADYSCKDEAGGSGLADPPDGCKGDVPNGATIDTSKAGQFTFTVSAKDKAGNKSQQQVTYTIVAVGKLQGGGTFAIGDQDASVGTQVTFWGAQWWKLNTLSGGVGPAAFKGFVDFTKTDPPACGDPWTTRPGNSSKPPDSIPGYIAVIVTSNVDKSGSTIGGNTKKVVLVKTDPGYEGNPGHAGTGKVVAKLCG